MQSSFCHSRNECCAQSRTLRNNSTDPFSSLARSNVPQILDMKLRHSEKNFPTSNLNQFPLHFTSLNSTWKCSKHLSTTHELNIKYMILYNARIGTKISESQGGGVGWCSERYRYNQTTKPIPQWRYIVNHVPVTPVSLLRLCVTQLWSSDSAPSSGLRNWWSGWSQSHVIFHPGASWPRDNNKKQCSSQ